MSEEKKKRPYNPILDDPCQSWVSFNCYEKDCDCNLFHPDNEELNERLVLRNENEGNDRNDKNGT